MDNTNERIAVIETELKMIKDEVKESKENLEKILHKVEGLETQVTKHLSFVGGVLFVISGIWTVVVFAKDWLITHLKG